MKLYIDEIPEEGLDVKIAGETVEHDNIVAPVKADLRVEKAGTEVHVSGGMHTTVQLCCSRCLKDFRAEMELSVDVVYHPVEELKGDETYEVRSDELDTGFYSKGEIDIPDLLVEQIMLNVPMKPLCSDECRGICVRCGADLSRGACECAEHITDSRFGVLKKLLSNKDQKEHPE